MQHITIQYADNTKHLVITMVYRWKKEQETPFPTQTATKRFHTQRYYKGIRWSPPIFPKISSKNIETSFFYFQNDGYPFLYSDEFSYKIF